MIERNKLRAFVTYVLAGLLICSATGLFNAEISKNDLILAAMLLLLVLDLKDFNFWGLQGSTVDLPAEGDAISDTAQPPSTENIAQAEQNTELQLMDNPTGNFLTVFAEIERLLGITAQSLYADQLKGKNKPGIVTKVLHAEGIITESGMQQIIAMRSLRNKIIHGMKEQLPEDLIAQGFQLALNFYHELRDWLNSQEGNQASET